MVVGVGLPVRAELMTDSQGIAGRCCGVEIRLSRRDGDGYLTRLVDSDLAGDEIHRGDGGITAEIGERGFCGGLSGSQGIAAMGGTRSGVHADGLGQAGNGGIGHREGEGSAVIADGA